MTAVSTVLTVLLAAIVVAVVVALFTTPRQPKRDSLSDLIDAVTEPASEPDPVDQHANTAAALLQPDAPIQPTWATALLAEIAALPTTADPEVTH